jgi:hypothetical protein
MTAVFLHEDGSEGTRMVYESFLIDGIELKGVRGAERVPLAWCTVAGTWVVLGEQTYARVRVEP